MTNVHKSDRSREMCNSELVQALMRWCLLVTSLGRTRVDPQLPSATVVMYSSLDAEMNHWGRTSYKARRLNIPPSLIPCHCSKHRWPYKVTSQTNHICKNIPAFTLIMLFTSIATFITLLATTHATAIPIVPTSETRQLVSPQLNPLINDLAVTTCIRSADCPPGLRCTTRGKDPGICLTRLKWCAYCPQGETCTPPVGCPL
jgi:hypothetical protein